MIRPRFCRILPLCLAAALFGAGTLAAAARASSPDKGLEETRGKIRSEQKTIRKLEIKGRDLLKTVESLDKEIAAAEKRRRASEARMAELRKEKRKAKKELEALEVKIRRRRADQGRRLAAFYRLGKTGILPIIFSDTPPRETFRNLDSLKRILIADWERLEAFQALLEERERMEARLEDRMKAEAALLETVAERKKALKAKRQEKTTLLFRIEQDKDLHDRLLKELRQAEKRLLDRMRREPPGPAFVAEGPLSGQKGKLAWPVKGKIRRRFGIRRAVRSKGIDIKTKPGTPVRAVWGGGVEYADWFRGYGKLLIIHHGAKDYTVVAHLSDLTKRKGERVEAGEIVGLAGDTGSVDGCVVHFEIWHGGRPEDPLKWLRPRNRRH